ncbi:MAG: DUF3793 family protein [Peptococcaceae bacterium]|jgi:hypothetical protein|nr:DUF3793 family protein [Peptococcaceae bacterium]
MSDRMENMLAAYCAPVLLGKKPAALFARPDWWEEAAASGALGRHGLHTFMFCRANKNSLIFVYNRGLLNAALRHEAVSRYLIGIGYMPRDGVQSCLNRIAGRFGNSGEFPHEIGFFLGYPPEDVLGFIHHRNQGCKLCGLWKVYSDVDRACGLFAEYERCKRVLLDYIRRGGSIARGGPWI